MASIEDALTGLSRESRKRGESDLNNFIWIVSDERKHTQKIELNVWIKYSSLISGRLLSNNDSIAEFVFALSILLHHY